MITEPGVYYDIAETDYHSDALLSPELGRSLSQSGAKTLLRSPQRFAYERAHGRPAKDEFDLGSMVHALVLRSRDNRIRVVDAYDWRTKDAQQARKSARMAGMVPVHRGELWQAAKIAAAVRRHPLAGPIFTGGTPEVTLYWLDPDTGVTVRARIDYVRHNALVDLKTTRYGGAEPAPFGNSAASYDYPMQGANYSDGWALLTGQSLSFVTVAVEVDPPHIVTVGQYAPEDLETGRARMRRALAEYAERESTDVWVDPPEVITIPVPPWYGRTA